MNKNFVRENTCPFCSHKTDSAFNEENENIKPNPGDIALCLMCGEVSEFDHNMILIKVDICKLDTKSILYIRKQQLIIAQIRYQKENEQ